MNRLSQFRASSFLIVLCVVVTQPARAELRLAGIFSDHMVLQRERSAPIWGWANEHQGVTIRFAGQTLTTTANEDGYWEVTLNALESSVTGRDLTVSCDGGQIRARDVVVGDVWHASGQSNMAMTVAAVARRLPQAEEDIQAAKLPAVRFRRISETESAGPLVDLPVRNGWTVCSPETVPNFSAAAFYFSRKLNAKLGVPIGIIDSSRGGTPIEPFIPRASFQSHPTLRRELELGDQGDLRGLWKLPGGVRARDANWLPGRLFHSRLAPIGRFAVQGIIWYQGESNCGDGEDPRDYQHKMRALITGWRTALGDVNLPFYFVQLPGSGARAGWPYLREQQRLSTDLPVTGMVVTIDLLDNGIHPPNKIDVGERLARWALAGAYQKQIPFSGPLFERAELGDGKATVYFLHAENGLMVATKRDLAEAEETSQANLANFELADAEGRWQPASAVIKDRTVKVTSEHVPSPVAVRYAYAVNPQGCNLYNREGLPASPFCSNPALLDYAPEIASD